MNQSSGAVRGVFITGTDTGVGKTVVSAALMHRYGDISPVRYWKPIQTGIEHDDDTESVARLSGCASDRLLRSGIRLARPLSPHLAARLAHTTIDLDALIGTFDAQPRSDRWIVEGAGGALVPINDRMLMTDLMARLGLPVIVVARSSLGTINHTLLTLEALRARVIPIAGVIMSGESNVENRKAIEHYGDVRILGELLQLSPLKPDALREAAMSIDPDSALRACFEDMVS